MTYSEVDMLTKIDRLIEETAERDPDNPAGAGQFDQYHLGGPPAVARILPSLALEPGRRLLDVGSGLGGPARQVADATGATVFGVDITREYVDVATALSERAGMSAGTRFICSDIAAFEGHEPFDAAMTLHVQMNVPNKTGWYSEIATHLRDGGRLAVWEICRSGDAQPAWPEPWSLDGSDSFLATPAELLSHIEAAGFQTTEWVDESAWLKRLVPAPRTNAAPAGPSPASLLDDGPARVGNALAALNSGILQVRRGAFTKQSS
jgi:SAM-dependent methyltransferase